jgi:hypothetical protein
MSCVTPPAPLLRRVTSQPIPNPIASRGGSKVSLCRGLHQDGVISSRTAAARAGIVGQPDTHRGALGGVVGKSYGRSRVQDRMACTAGEMRRGFEAMGQHLDVTAQVGVLLPPEMPTPAIFGPGGCARLCP